MTRSVNSGEPRPEAPERGPAAGYSPMTWMLISRLRGLSTIFRLSHQTKTQGFLPVLTSGSSTSNRITLHLGEGLVRWRFAFAGTP